MYEENFYHLNEDTEVLNEIGIRKKIGALIGRYKEKGWSSGSINDLSHRMNSVEMTNLMKKAIKFGRSLKGISPEINKHIRYKNLYSNVSKNWRVHDPEVIRKHLGKNWERVKNHVKKHLWALTHKSKD